ncbi:MAG: DUF58 domain-containing protein [Pirellula sp.]|jgi:uncharacterized protein (DUF58 family)|nr:DUF58 domain-containing protein [Pirellula sp.]
MFIETIGEFLPFWAPWIAVFVLTTTLFLLAMVRRIYPTKQWWLLVVPSVVLLLIAVKFPGLIPFVYFLDILALVAVAFDFFTITKATKIRVERQMIRTASLGGTQNVELILENRNSRGQRLEIRDGLPPNITASPDSQKCYVASQQRLELNYTLNPKKRGAFPFEYVYLRLVSLFGFWFQEIKRPLPAMLSVYPDMKQLAEYAVLARTNRLSLIGVRKTRKLGQDNNFERLRDYTQDDNYKHIDWRSTARRNKLTVKQFQTDQSQRVMFLLDCGRLMTSEYRGLSLLDYALNSILMLSYVALQQKDSVGLLCFSDRIESYVPIHGGPSQMNRILHAGFDRFPSLRQTNFDQAFMHLSKHCRKRSLVVLVTTIIDDVTAAQITGYLSNLSGRHLPLLCLLRDRAVFDYADNPDLDPYVLYRTAAAAQLLTWRHQVIQRMHQAGVLQVDAFPDELTSPLVNEYLTVKAKHLL